jgi:hypothetical protein
MREDYNTVWYCHLPQKTWSADHFGPVSSGFVAQQTVFHLGL